MIAHSEVVRQASTFEGLRNPLRRHECERWARVPLPTEGWLTELPGRCRQRPFQCHHPLPPHRNPAGAPPCRPLATQRGGSPSTRRSGPSAPLGVRRRHLPPAHSNAPSDAGDGALPRTARRGACRSCSGTGLLTPSRLWFPPAPGPRRATKPRPDPCSNESQRDPARC